MEGSFRLFLRSLQATALQLGAKKRLISKLISKLICSGSVQQLQMQLCSIPKHTVCAAELRPHGVRGTRAAAFGLPEAGSVPHIESHLTIVTSVRLKPRRRGASLKGSNKALRALGHGRLEQPRVLHFCGKIFSNISVILFMQ